MGKLDGRKVAILAAEGVEQVVEEFCEGRHEAAAA
jgi:hypothetical protein